MPLVALNHHWRYWPKNSNCFWKKLKFGPLDVKTMMAKPVKYISKVFLVFSSCAAGHQYVQYGWSPICQYNKPHPEALEVPGPWLSAIMTRLLKFQKEALCTKKPHVGIDR